MCCAGFPPHTMQMPSPVWHRWSDRLCNNTLSAVLLTEALVDQFRAPGGRIVFTSSIAALRGLGQGCYGASKAALYLYCHDLFKTLGPQGIVVVSLHRATSRTRDSSEPRCRRLGRAARFPSR
ncbi:NAD(P)-dependent dehydrogenase (short-subunit alcohol dehydrogenase family) [Paraburkholderia sp. EB58]|jgi:NAD(P)-dependent dehydrogenase (short-subunit alcohol dehydrogenase family)|uniref:SDR family NAD(P)-dependent oxidoreductase n=1 Tax=Paraburkholderia sp. EB58 TaxID=3035125 RepID=UPI003D214AF4